MPDMTSIEINAKDPQNKSIKTTISYVNPNAQPSVLKLLGQKLTNLTQNTYESTTRVDKTNIDTETDKPDPPIVLKTDTYNTSTQTTSETTIQDGGEYNIDISTLTERTGYHSAESKAYSFSLKFQRTTSLDTLVEVVRVTSNSDETYPMMTGDWKDGSTIFGTFWTVMSALKTRSVCDVVYTCYAPSNDTYAPYNLSFTIHFINPGGEG